MRDLACNVTENNSKFITFCYILIVLISLYYTYTMTDVAASTTVNTETQVAPGKKGTNKDKKKTDRPKPAHPTTAVMVNNAIQNLKERGGSSLQAIKKYISATYKIDGEKFSPFIKKYLKASVAAGSLVQTKGKGASGSFKLASSAVTKKPTTVSKPKKVAVKPAPKGKVTDKKKMSVTETKKSAPVKTAKTKKAAVAEKKKPVVQAAAAAKSKSPSKAKKTAKAPTKKPKSPKPKTTKSKVAKKKTASPKKK